MFNGIKISIFIFIASLALSVDAQKLNTVRLEVPADIDVEGYNVEVLGEIGVLVFYESNELDKEKKRKWYFGLFDTQLKQQWMKFVHLANKMQFIDSYYFKNKVHLLFRNIGRGRNESGYYEIVSLDLVSNKFEQISGTFPAKAELTGIEVIGKHACLGINLNKNETDLLFINLANGAINPVKLAAGEESYIETVYANQFSKEFYVALKVKKDNRYIKDLIHVFGPEGIRIETVEIVTEDNVRVLRKFRFEALDKKQILVFGVFDLHTGRLPDFDKMEDEDKPKSAGLFFFKFSNNNVGSVKFIDFSRLDNIHGSIAQRNTTKVKKTDGGSSGVYGAFFNISKPQLINNGDNYILSAELYKPHYRTETRMDYDFYGRPYPYTYSVFDGYLFFDVIVVDINNEGDLIWNNDYIIRDLKSYSLSRHSVVFSENEFVTTAYVNNGRVYSKVFDGALDIDSDESIIATNNGKDRIDRDENNFIEKWYDGYFLIYGYQRILNRSLSKQNERTIFYLNKIAYK